MKVATLALVFGLAALSPNLGVLAQKCKDEFSSYIKCVTTDAANLLQAKAIKQNQDNLAKCFKSAGCRFPTSDNDRRLNGALPAMLAGAMKMFDANQRFKSVAADVKKCLIEEVAGPRVEKILREHGAPDFEFPDIPEKEIFALDDEMEFIFRMHRKAHLGLLLCTNAAAKSNATECLLSMKTDCTDRMCALRNNCVNTTLSDGCKDEQEKTIRAAGAGMKAKALELAEALASLQNKTKVTVGDTMKILIGPESAQESLLKEIASCFAKFKKLVPFPMSMVMNMAGLSRYVHPMPVPKDALMKTASILETAAEEAPTLMTMCE